MVRKKVISIFLAFILMLISSIMLIIYSMYSYKIYHYPMCENGIIAFENDKDVSKNIMLHPLGEVEFYYNRWIITDNDTNPMDSYIRIPSKWSDKLNNKITYSKDGYGSYKLTLKYLTPGSKLLINPETLSIASNFYFNGEYVGSIGKPSKTEKSSASDLKQSTIVSYTVPEDGIAEFVIECGYNNFGGLHSMPPIQLDNYDYSYSNFLRYMFGISFGTIIFVIIIAIIISRNKRFLLLPTLILSIIHYAVSYDLLILLREFGIFLNYNNLFFATFITGTLLILAILFYLIKNGIINLKLKHYLPIIIISLVLITTYPLAMFTGYNLIHVAILLILAIIEVVFMIKNIIDCDKINIEFFIFFTILGALLAQALDYLDIVMISCYGFVSVSIIFASAIAIFVYIQEIKNLYINDKIKNEIEIENLKYKQELLLKQIKPHFIYNSLASIQALYHKDINEGDEGIVCFSKYLRTNVDSIDTDLVSFSDEIDTIINYIDLNNLSLENKFNLILDIEYDDFNIPLLSLQPIIENSIKYSGVNEKRDGYIKVSSFIEDNIVNIIISNNGIPFDTGSITNKSKGLKNISERLKLFLKAEVSIASDANETKTIIRFKKEVTNSESNNS